MATITKTYGTIGGFTLTQQYRPIADADYASGVFGYPAPRLVSVLTLDDGKTSTDFAVAGIADNTPVPGEVATLTEQARAVMAAFAAIGAEVMPGNSQAANAPGRP